MAKVSILIPTFNRLAWLKESIASVLAQDVDLELLVLDNGSTDGTRYYLDELEIVDSRLRVFHSSVNGRERWERLLPHATGEYLVLFCDDDRMLPGGLAAKIEALEENSSAGLVFSAVRLLDDEGKDLGRSTMGEAENPTFGQLFTGNFIPMPSAVFRRDWATYYKDYHGKPDCAGLVGDWQLWLDIINRSKAICIPQETVALRQHTGQETNMGGVEKFRKPILAVWEYWLHRGHRPTVAEWQTMACTAVKLGIDINHLCKYRDLVENVCLTMIVKNEAGIIERCLASVKPHIHSWCIVDTGSTDGTQDIIKAFLANKPGKLYEVEEWDGFANARNHAFTFARYQGASHCMIIDADEILEKPAAAGMADVLMAEVKSQGRSAWRVFMVRADYQGRWIGRVHEDLQPFGLWLGSTAVIDSRDDGARHLSASRANEDLIALGKDINENPNNPRAWYYLGATYFHAKDYAQAAKAFNIRLRFEGDPLEKQKAAEYLAAIQSLGEAA